MPRYYAALQETERVFTSGAERITRPEAAYAYFGPHKARAEEHVERVESEGKRAALAQIDVDEGDDPHGALRDRVKKQTEEWRA